MLLLLFRGSHGPLPPPAVAVDWLRIRRRRRR